MNKIATYLNQHLLGEASSAKAVRKRFSRDGSILTITPEIVVFPRVTNDIRKVARFTWQLAEKGHKMGVTIRGSGGDTTGAAIGKGITIDMSAHLRSIITIAAKDRLAHVQPGIPLEVIEHALRWQGLTLAQQPDDLCHTTVGGAIASGLLGASGSFSDAIEKLEVVLANGDVIETGRVSKNDVNKKLGLQTFEGELYRKLSGLFEDNEELLTQIAQNRTMNTTGYPAITRVRQKDGSYDLTPLFVGSQGTLGFISEVVLKTEYYSDQATAALIVLDTPELARDLGDRVAELTPSRLVSIDGALINRVAGYGKQLSLIGEQTVDGAVLLVVFGDASDRAQQHKLKKLRKLTKKLNITTIDSTDHELDGFLQLLDLPQVLARMAEDDGVDIPLLDGAYVPADRREEHAQAVAELASKQHVDLPSISNLLTGTVTYYPSLKLHSVSDKQKLFRLLNEYAVIVSRCGGAYTSDGAEGRLKANASLGAMDEAEVGLYEQVRAIFDPFGTMNPGVKQKNELRTLVANLRTSYDTTDFLA